MNPQVLCLSARSDLRKAPGPEQVPELRFSAVVPITTGEMDLKLTHRLETLLNRLNEAGVTEPPTPDRVNADPAPKRSWWQRLRD